MSAKQPPHWALWFIEAASWVALFGLGAVVLAKDLTDSAPQLITESSLAESLQFALLLGAALLLAAGSRRDCLWLNGWIALLLAMAIRESDFLLDEHLFEGAWELGVTAVATTFVAWWLLQRPGFMTDGLVVVGVSGYLVCAVAVIAASQGIGYKWIWIELLGPNSDRNAKNFAEEATEIVGFALFFMGGVRYRILSHARESGPEHRLPSGHWRGGSRQ